MPLGLLVPVGGVAGILYGSRQPCGASVRLLTPCTKPHVPEGGGLGYINKGSKVRLPACAFRLGKNVVALLQSACL